MGSLQTEKFVSFLKSFFFSSANPLDFIKRDQWTLEILSLLAKITLIPIPLILIAIALGYLQLKEFYLSILCQLGLVIGWLAARRGGWRWAGWLPPILSLFLAVYGMKFLGIHNSTILVLAISVVFSGMLQGNRTSLLFALLGTAGYVYASYDPAIGLSARFLLAILIVLISLLLLSFGQWFFFMRLREYIKALLDTQQELEGEISRREKAEKIQHIQESRIKHLTDNITDLVAEIDLRGNFLYASPSYEKVLGYTPEELQHISAFSLVHPDDYHNVVNTIERIKTDSSSNIIQYRIKHARGYYLWMESSGAYIIHADDVEKTLVVSSHDITRQKLAEENKLASEMKYRSIIENVPLGVHLFLLEEDGRLVFTGCNPSADLILNLDHSQFIGQTIEEVFPSLTNTDIPDRYRQVAQTGIPWSEDQVDYMDKRVRGIYELHAFQTAPRKVAVFFADVTEKSKAAEALRLSEEKFSTTFLTSPDSVNINRLSDGLYVDINQGFLKTTGYTREEVIGKTSLELNIWVNPADRERMVEGIRKDGIVENLDAQFRGKDGHIVQGLLSARLIKVDGEPCLLNITRDITERRLAEMHLQDAHDKLERAYEATLQGWAHALDLREHETADHSRRVVEYTVRMASALGIGQEELVDVQRGALLHDLGKVGVPDNILLKPGPLTNDEWVIMRQHPMNAYNLLKGIEYLHSALDIPYCHHEHWDGSGYPRGLKGEEIPLVARIFTVVDVWDALLSDRPYRPAWDKPAVINYLREQRGKLFDPEIVHLFLKTIAEEPA